jgi:hypothetical protein
VGRHTGCAGRCHDFLDQQRDPTAAPVDQAHLVWTRRSAGDRADLLGNVRGVERLQRDAHNRPGAQEVDEGG